MYTHIRTEPSNEQIAIATDIFKLVSDPTRLKILWALLHGEHSVGKLAKEVGARPAAVSQHLAKLRISHMVSVRREGTKLFYQAENEHVRSIIQQTLSQARHIATGESHD